MVDVIQHSSGIVLSVKTFRPLNGFTSFPQCEP